MANGMILRGEIYWVSVDDSIGAEIQTGRPAVIISGDKANETSPCVLVAFITSQGNCHPHNVSILMKGEARKVKCDQIRTVAKERLTRYVCTLTKPEMVRVTGALATAMCIPIRSPGQEPENKEIAALKAECEMWKRCYDVTMTQLVELKVNNDLALRMADRYDYEDEQPIEVDEEPEPEEPVKTEPVKVDEPEQPKPEQHEEPDEPNKSDEPDKVEINTCTIDELKKCGCTTDLAQIIMDGRPYMNLEDLRRVNGVTGVAYGILKHKLCCVPVKVEEEPEPEPEIEPVVEETEPVEAVSEPAVEKVEINTASARELMEKLGICRTHAYSITGYRKKNGRFVSHEELLEVKGIFPGTLKEIADKITIDGADVVLEGAPKEPEQPVMLDDKVNINTASAQEICDALGLSKTVCYSIVGHRKREGLYKSVDELLNVPRFTKNHFEKYRDMVTVGEIEDEDEDEEPKSEKLNVNTASLRDLMAVGFEKRAAALIVNERKKYGRFRSLDEVAEIPEITGRIMRKLRDKLEV